MNSRRNRESSAMREPRTVGEILHNYLINGNEFLSVGYSEYKAMAEGEADVLFKDFFPDTRLAVDLKLLKRKPGRMSVGAYLDGTLVHDGDDHFLFAEKVVEKEVKKRNPCHYQGQHISYTIRPDGKPRLNFKQLKLDAGFNKFRYASEVMNEVIQALDLAGI